VLCRPDIPLLEYLIGISGKNDEYKKLKLMVQRHSTSPRNDTGSAHICTVSDRAHPLSTVNIMYTLIVLSGMIFQCNCKIYRVSEHQRHHRMFVWRAFSDSVLMGRFFYILCTYLFSSFIVITLYFVNLNK